MFHFTIISLGSCFCVVNIVQVAKLYLRVTTRYHHQHWEAVREREGQSVRQTQGTHVSLQSIGTAHLASGVIRRQPFCGPLSSSKVHMSHSPQTRGEPTLHTLLEAHATRLPAFLPSLSPCKELFVLGSFVVLSGFFLQLSETNGVCTV